MTWKLFSIAFLILFKYLLCTELWIFIIQLYITYSLCSNYVTRFCINYNCYALLKLYQRLVTCLICPECVWITNTWFSQCFLVWSMSEVFVITVYRCRRRRVGRGVGWREVIGWLCWVWGWRGRGYKQRRSSWFIHENCPQQVSQITPHRVDIHPSKSHVAIHIIET